MKDKKFAYILKGASFALLAVAGILLTLALTGHPVVIASATAMLAGLLMIGNSIVQVVELVGVNPQNGQKWYGVYKTLSLVASLAAVVFLLTAFVANPSNAMIAATVAIYLCAIIDGAEAAVL